MTPESYVGRQPGVSRSSHPCPVCGGKTNRTQRRGWDHITSLFVPIRRYRCANFSCGWEGNWRVGQEGLALRRKRRLPTIFVASMALIATSAVAAIAFGLLEVLPGLQTAIANVFGN